MQFCSASGRFQGFQGLRVAFPAPHLLLRCQERLWISCLVTMRAQQLMAPDGLSL